MQTEKFKFELKIERYFEFFIFQFAKDNVV